MSSSQQFCTFLLAGAVYGTPVAKVQEVIYRQPMTRVPLAPDAVCGLMNLRGQIVLAVDLRRRFGLAPADQPPINVVVHTADGAVSLLVDDIGDVMEVDEDTLENPPETLRGAARQVVRGVYKLSGRLLLELDIDRVVDLENPAKSERAEQHQGTGADGSVQSRGRSGRMP